MANLLPQGSLKKAKAEERARFLLSGSLALLCCAILFCLALLPAELAARTLQSPALPSGSASGNVAEESAALARAKSLLGTLSSLQATSSLPSIEAALAHEGKGVAITEISYAAADGSITLTGHADTPEEVNTLRQGLESDARFTDVSIPVAALLGSQNGGFTISMKLAQ